MPAVVRGGRRQSSKPAPKKSTKGQSGRTSGRNGAARAAVPAGKLHALSGVGLSPRATGVGVAVVLALAGGLVLSTGGRAQALGSAVNHVIDRSMAGAGFRLEKVHVEG